MARAEFAEAFVCSKKHTGYFRLKYLFSMACIFQQNFLDSTVGRPYSCTREF
jgi:hypothetical protein